MGDSRIGLSSFLCLCVPLCLLPPFLCFAASGGAQLHSHGAHLRHVCSQPVSHRALPEFSSGVRREATTCCGQPRVHWGLPGRLPPGPATHPLWPFQPLFQQDSRSGGPPGNAGELEWSPYLSALLLLPPIASCTTADTRSSHTHSLSTTVSRCP